MKHHITLLLAILATTTLFAQPPLEKMQLGNEAYKNGDFTSAVQWYSTILDDGQECAELYYNLGNAYYRLDELGLAILNYERALRLQPNMRAAQENLTLAQSHTEDQITPLPEVFLVQWGRSVLNWFTPTGWRVAILLLALLLGTATVLFILNGDYRWRKGALIGGGVTALLLVLAIVCTLASSARHNHHNAAIVTQPMVVVKGSPDRHAVDKFILHEGTRVTLDETLDEWYEISIADGNNGWIHANEITII